jgi:hypothetical protein
MNEDNLNISVRDLKKIRKDIMESKDGIIFIGDRPYDVSRDKKASEHMLTILIDVIRVRNGIIYG